MLLLCLFIQDYIIKHLLYIQLLTCVMELQMVWILAKIKGNIKVEWAGTRTQAKVFRFQKCHALSLSFLLPRIVEKEFLN